jgi:hypothetical protein
MAQPREYVAYRLAQLGITKRTPKTYYRGMTWERAQAIRAEYFANRTPQRVLAKRYGISQGNVSRIVSGQVFAREPLLKGSYTFWHDFLAQCVDEARANT